MPTKLVELLRKVYERITVLTAAAWAHSLRLVSAIAIALVLWQSTISEVIVDLVDVPAELSARGLVPKVVTARIIDELRSHQWDEVLYERSGASFRLLGDQVDIEAPGGGTSLQSVVRYIRHVVGAEDLRISGEITMSGDDLTLRLRGSRADRFRAVTITKSATRFDELTRAAGRAILEQVDPLTLATSVSMEELKPDPAVYVPLVEKVLRSGDARERSNALLLLGYLAQGEGRTAEAMDLARQAAMVNPNSAAAFHLLGECLLPKDASAAIPNARRAISLSPRHEEGYHLLARALIAEGRDDEAVSLLVASLDKADDPISAFSLLSQTLRRLGRSERLLQIALERDRRLNRHPGYHYGVGRALMEQGRFDEGIARVHVGMRLANRPAMAAHGHRHIGEAYAAKGDHQKAVEAFKASLALNPNLSVVKQALEVSTRAIEAGPEPQR